MTKIEVELQAVYGGDREIAEAAWTSSSTKQRKEQRSEEDVARIVNMLADSKHSVPFESVIFRFWYRIPIQADRQHMTHRIASHSGMSGRYRTMPNDFLSIPTDVVTVLHKMKDTTSAVEYHAICEKANEWYREFLEDSKDMRDQGIITGDDYKRVREFFRGVLPQNNMTERVSVMNLRAFANYVKLRAKNDAQPEIQTMANMMLDAVRESGKCPIAIEALERNNWSI